MTSDQVATSQLTKLAVAFSSSLSVCGVSTAQARGNYGQIKYWQDLNNWIVWIVWIEWTDWSVWTGLVELKIEFPDIPTVSPRPRGWHRAWHDAGGHSRWKFSSIVAFVTGTTCDMYWELSIILCSYVCSVEMPYQLEYFPRRQRHGRFGVTI